MNSRRTIYLDFNATTPLDPMVREEMFPYLDNVYGNPSSIHHIGREARCRLDEARDRVARFLRCKPSEVIFTSGGTESINLAVFGVARKFKSKGRHLITSQIEHHAVLHAMDYLERSEGYEVTRIPVDSTGRTDPQDFIRALRPDTVLVSLQAANNEIGTIQPIAEVGKACRDRGILFHTDAVQWFGKQLFSQIDAFEADLVSLCAHKFHGPKGAGLLYARSPLLPDPLLFGGGHENERRAGTENLAGIIGLTAAVEAFVKPPVFAAEAIVEQTERLRVAVEAFGDLGVRLRSPKQGGLVNTVAFTVERTDSMTLLANLDLEGICASSGSACSAGSLEPSHVVKALGASDAEARALVRFSLGRGVAGPDVDRVISVLPDLIRRSQG